MTGEAAAFGGRPLSSGVARLSRYYSPQLEVAVRLNTNEAPEEPPARFVAELKEALGHLSLNRYPDREARRLRRAIGVHHGVDEEAVYCANGSNEVIQSLLLAYGGPGRSCVVFEPTYALHSHIARLTSTGVIAGGRRADYRVDPAEAKALLAGEGRGAAIVFLCSPNNPTGVREDDETIVAVAEQASGLVLVDEAYGQFSERSVAALIERFANVVVLRTFSKTWSLAGLRLGYLLARPEVVESCLAVALPYHLDAIKQEAGVLALAYDEEMAARVRRIVAERSRLAASIAALGVEVTPSEANFLLVRVGEATEVWQRLLDRSVLVRDVSAWPHLEGCLRVTVGTPDEDDAFLAALGAALA